MPETKASHGHAPPEIKPGCHHAAEGNHSACHPKGRFDYLLWGSLILIVVLYTVHTLFDDQQTLPGWFATAAQSTFDLVNTMWWGIMLGIVMVAVLAKIPREFVIAVIGRGGGLSGILRATLGGLLLDLCNHGILMVGAKLYERGASAGQVIAFLVASPWNSFSLTLILIALIGIKWTLAFIVLSMAIAIIAGLMFELLTKKGVVPANPNKIDLPADFRFWSQAQLQLRATRFTPAFLGEMARDGLRDSRMVIRWILFGIVLASLVRAFVSPESYGTYFGPTLMGLGLTVVAATLLEVCSEGSTPIAADLLTRAGAPGNSFAFLMTGVATDYTEIMVLKETTRTWRVPLLLPLITVPQILVVAWLMNTLA